MLTGLAHDQYIVDLNCSNTLQMFHSHGVLRLILSFLGLKSLIQCKQVCKFMNELLSDNTFWSNYMLKYLFTQNKHFMTIQLIFQEDSFVIVRRIFSLLQIQRAISLLDKKIIAVSSLDRAEESPVNVLTISNCYHYRHNRNKEIAQLICGCAVNRPCYWSSHPSPIPETIEYITFKLMSPLVCIFGFNLTVYQAFFQPNHPIYGPCEVCIQFLVHSPSSQVLNDPFTISLYDKNTSDNMVYYESEYFPVNNIMLEQHFTLNRPLLCIGGQVRLLFKGMQQRQILDFVDQQEYYLCISHVEVVGVDFPEFHVNTTINLNNASKDSYNFSCRHLATNKNNRFNYSENPIALSPFVHKMM
eukprot:gene10002-13457_t